MLLLNSTVWFKVTLAKYYARAGMAVKAVKTYEEILRMLEVKKDNQIPLVNKLSFRQEYAICKYLIHYYKNTDLIKTISYTEKLIELAPEEESNYNEVLLFYLKIPNYEKAAYYSIKFEKYSGGKVVLNLQENSLLCYYKGKNLLKENMWHRAVEEFGKAVILDPGFADAYFQLGLSYENMGEPESSVEHYEIAYKLLPTHLDSLKKLERIYNEKKDTDKSGIIEREIKKLAPIYKLDLNLGNKFLALGYDVVKINDDKVKIKFLMKCIGTIDGINNIWFNGIIKDKDDLRFGVENNYPLDFNYGLLKDSEKPQIGEVYEKILALNNNLKYYNTVIGFSVQIEGKKDSITLFKVDILGI